MEKVYVLGGARSYIGVENGMYRHICAEKLGAAVLKKVAGGYCSEEIDLVIAGNAVGAGGNITRLMLLEAGMPQSIPAVTVDLQCGSGLESIAIAAAKIKSGQADLVIAGGFESSSTAPRRGYHRNHPDYEIYGGEQGFYYVAKFMPGEHRMTAMLEGAEKTALSLGITRGDLDRWVLRSHRLAKETREEGFLQDILVGVEEEGDFSKKQTYQCVGGCRKKNHERDEGIRDRMSTRFLKRLPCVLKDGKVITAANSSLTNDGAAFVILCSGRYLHSHNFFSKAEFLDVAEVGVDPSMSPKSANVAIERLLMRNRLSADDIDIFECNEAFAVIDELFARKYPKAVGRYNILGGALAYGHPYGASGGIITVHALKALERVNGRLAVCSIAAAGGVGTAILLRREGNPG